MRLQPPFLFRRSIRQGVVLCLLLLSASAARTAEIDLVSLPVSLDMLEQRFLWNEAGLLTGTRATQLSAKGQSMLEEGDIEQIIDSDPCSGVTLRRDGKFSFLLNLNKISRVRMLVITGALKDATLSVKVSNRLLATDADGWKTLVADKPMQDPSTSVVFRPEPILQAVVTIRTGASEQETAPSFNDISFFGERDVREFALASKPQKRETSPSSGPQPAYSFVSFSDVRHPESIFNLAGMYADARIAYISPSAPTENANAINDGNADSTWTFDSRKTESLAVLDLGTNRRMRRVSLVHSQYPGELLCYAVKDLPWDTPPVLKTALLAWLPPAGGSFLADFPLLAQATPSTPALSRNMQVTSAIFDRMPRAGAVKTDSFTFTQFNLPSSTEARYVVLRHMNGAVDHPIGFRINEMSALGNYTPTEFTLSQRQLPPLDDRPLIALPGAAPTAPTSSVDPSDLGLVKTPPPASPSAP